MREEPALSADQSPRPPLSFPEQGDGNPEQGDGKQPELPRLHFPQRPDGQGLAPAPGGYPTPPPAPPAGETPAPRAAPPTRNAPPPPPRPTPPPRPAPRRPRLASRPTGLSNGAPSQAHPAARDHAGPPGPRSRCLPPS